MRRLHILNLGAGVQSTVLYIAAAQKLFDLPIDFAIFADTGEEPGAVYRHLEWLKTIGGPPILVGSKGRLGDHLMNGVRHLSDGTISARAARFASIPAFTAPRGAERATGIMQRQCTKEYKIEVIDTVMRRQALGLAPRKHVPRDLIITNYYGISLDEAGRSTRIRARTDLMKRREVRFPLIEMGMTRADCHEWLHEHGNVPHQTPRSACVFCPYHRDDEWLRIKTEDPEGWARAVEIDEGLRRPGAVVNRKLDQELFLHKSVRPLTQIDFAARIAAREPQEPGIGVMECEGMCGL